MTSIPLYDIQGKKLEELEVSDTIFAVPPREALVKQVYTVLMGNRREGLAHTKDRADRAGSGRKPWKQKGTGRARTGSVRNPIWRKGGVIFGPTNERNFKRRVNVKMRRRAAQMVMSEKIRSGQVLAVSEFPEAENLKTKDCARFLEKVNVMGSVLFALDASECPVFRSCRNLPKTQCVLAQDVDAARMLDAKTVIFSKRAIEAFEKRFGE